VDIIRTLYYIQGALGDENILAVLLCVTLLWALHIVIKQQFFLHLFVSVSLALSIRDIIELILRDSFRFSFSLLPPAQRCDVGGLFSVCPCVCVCFDAE